MKFNHIVIQIKWVHKIYQLYLELVYVDKKIIHKMMYKFNLVSKLFILK